MAASLFYLMIGLVCVLTLILLFCEYSCRGDVISNFEDTPHPGESYLREEEQELTMNNNNDSQEDVVGNMATFPTRKVPEVEASSSGRRASIKILVRQDSVTSTPCNAV